MSTALDGIPSLVFTGFGRLPASCVRMLVVSEPQAARAAFRRLAERVDFGPPSGHRTVAVQFGLTVRGLARLGMARSAIESFPFAFREPMASPHRIRALGDLGASHPSGWAWNGDSLDAALWLFAGDTEALQQADRTIADVLRGGFEIAHEIPLVSLDDQREHFGFRDGLSQPAIRELGASGEDDSVALGEFVLGRPDESGDRPEPPHDGRFELGQDGTFLVLRQISQDVGAFWDAMRGFAGPDGAVPLASKLIGRWPDGRPLAAAAPGPESEPEYVRDPHGLACPRGAHVRRAHPRDALHPDPAVSRSIARRHRLLRRGRPYGAPAPPELYPPGVRVSSSTSAPVAREAERGLLFACLCADLARQFEFVQQTWLNSAKHDGLFDEVCPVSAGREIPADGRRFTIPALPIRRKLHAMPHFVTVRGGAYLFLPSRAALRHLSLAPGSVEAR